MPDVSVVVPAHGRPDGLAALLDALGRQTLAAECFEVIVVDDGSAPPLAPTGVRLLRHQVPRGPAAARNTGWRAARAPLVAFTDDDCLPVAGWLEALLAAAGDGVVVQGPVRVPEAERAQLRPLSHAIEVEGATPLCVSANIAYPRALLERTGGFDERFAAACGEDVELGARVLRAGGELRFAPGAIVHHPLRQPSLGELLRYTWRWTDAVRALAMHPELRELLVGRVFWKPTHPWALLALAGLAARRPWLALPWAILHARAYRGRPALLARELPRHAVVDAAELATAVAGSIRHRTLML